MFRRRTSYRYLLLLSPVLWLALVCCACGPRATSIKGNTEGYDLDHPMYIDLPTALNEISGLWYYAKDTSLFAIVDEDGFLYKIFPKHPDHILRWKFAGHGDYEDLTVVGNTFYILRSDGVLFATTIVSGDSIESVKYTPPEEGNEYESIYYDDSLRLLVMVCKDCNEDKKKSLSTLGFNPETKQFVPGPFGIYAKAIASIIGQKSIKFKPSAATLNPFTGKLIILSAVNDLLVMATRDGSVLQAYPLDPKIYKQPEGVAIGADRTLYISNESHKIGSANILVMPYRAKKKK
jgi:hypothetical protein